MQISGHYTGFPNKTLVVITNHDRARMFFAHGHEFSELDAFALDAREEALEAQLARLYDKVHKRIDHGVTAEGFSDVIVCIPEINRPTFHACTPPDAAKRITRIVPKNLSAMDIGPIVRILIEG